MVSIVICTHNRADVITHCLDSFVSQTVSPNLFELIVVDNGSTDNTKQLSLSFSDKIKNFRYVFEEKVGLSNARNRGFQESKYDWVSYVDDDAKAYPNYVERVIWVINNFSFDCFGGRFFPWYMQPKPKWLSNEFGEFPLLQKSIGMLSNGKDVAGGVIVFRKAVLYEVNGFPSELGMSGNNVGYGEENWVQNELRKRSYTIGFDPELKIDHLVAPYKFTLQWHFKRQYAKGKADRLLNKRKTDNIFVILILAFGITLKGCFRNGVKLILKKNYYYQNYVLDSFGYLVRRIGYIGK